MLYRLEEKRRKACASLCARMEETKLHAIRLHARVCHSFTAVT